MKMTTQLVATISSTGSSTGDRPIGLPSILLKALQPRVVIATALLLLTASWQVSDRVQALRGQWVAQGEFTTVKNINQGFDERFDRLQRQQQIRQELNQQQPQPRFAPQESPVSSPALNQLQTEQQIQQQLNLYELQYRQGADPASSRTMDRLQWEQQMQMQLNQ